MSLQKRDTLLIPSLSASGFGKKHLHVAVTEPVDSGNRTAEILLLSIASIRAGQSGYDPTCVLQPGDHPFIKHDSYVVYRKAVIAALRDLQRMLDNGIITRKERMDADVVERMVAGAGKSPAIKNYILDFLHRVNSM